MEHTIEHIETDTKGYFLIKVEGERLAEMTYSKAGDKLIIIDHTDVSDKLRGQKVGEKLVERAVAHAREKGIKILPLCPFAKSILSKREDLQDVL